MRMLERHFNVSLRYGGGFVESINGLSGSSARRDWFYYVNGIEAAKGAAGTGVNQGDRIWWDLHDWTATDSIPAVVGFVPRAVPAWLGGRRFPTVLQCAADAEAACKRVSTELSWLGVPVADRADRDRVGYRLARRGRRHVARHPARDRREPAPAGAGRERGLRPILGRRQRARAARPPRPCRQDARGRRGLVAATAQGSATPTWLVIGTDLAGVNAAAAALTPTALHDHFALAVQGSSRLACRCEGRVELPPRARARCTRPEPRSAAGYCLALGLASLLLSAPLALGAAVLAIVLAGASAGVGRSCAARPG